MVMTDVQALAVLDELQSAEMVLWVDGGWGIDALIGRQTRPHDDLDLVVAADQIETVYGMLVAAGFAVERNWLPTAVALRHVDGRAVDLHPVELTPDGGGDQILRDGSRWHYDAPVEGIIGDRHVRCCSVSTQMRSHLGYEPDADDIADLRALADCFGLPLPTHYDR